MPLLSGVREYLASQGDKYDVEATVNSILNENKDLYGETEDYYVKPHTGCAPDLYPDQIINFRDLSVLANRWLQTVP